MPDIFKASLMSNITCFFYCLSYMHSATAPALQFQELCQIYFNSRFSNLSIICFALFSLSSRKNSTCLILVLPIIRYPNICISLPFSSVESSTPGIISGHILRRLHCPIYTIYCIMVSVPIAQNFCFTASSTTLSGENVLSEM